MLRTPRMLAVSFALLLATVATAPARGWAAAFSRGAERIAVHLINRGERTQTIKVDGRIYAVQPHEGLDIKAPTGTVVYAAGESIRYHDGDKLLSLTPNLKDKTVYFNCDQCPMPGA
jgi:hypothetical protein